MKPGGEVSMRPIIDVQDLTHRYGSHTALTEVCLTVPEGALYALLGPNGAGKTTLLNVIMGLRRPARGLVTVLGKEPDRLTRRDRADIGWVSEGQRLPGWMTLASLERYVKPLYPKWDADLATRLRRDLRLPSDRKLARMSRGERMKAALLCALAPRPRLLVMDEPFTGMDALVKDELVHGLLDAAAEAGTTVLVCSHDIGELEALADWVGFLDRGRLVFSEPMEVLRERFRRVELVTDGEGTEPADPLPGGWLAVESSGRRTTFLVAGNGDPGSEAEIRKHFPEAARVTSRPATLREVFVALAKEPLGTDREGRVA